MIALALWPNISMADVSGPIQVSLNISKFPIINETTNVSLKVVSIYDAPNTTAEVILPEGCILSSGEVLKTLDLEANIPVFLNASIRFTQIGDFKLEANAVHVTGPNVGWVDSDAIFMTIGENASYPTPPPTYVGELVQEGMGNGTQIAAQGTPMTFERMNEIAKGLPPISEPKPIVTEKETEKDDADPNVTNVSLSGTPDIQVTLFWNDKVDLDLHVIDPNNEEIFYAHTTSASGGRLDRDNRCGGWVQGAPENIIWPEGVAPSGHYKIKVVYYGDCENHPNPIQFTVKTYIKGQEVLNRLMTISPPADRSGGVTVWEFNYPNVKALTLRGNVGYYTGSGPYRDNDNTRVNAKHFLVQLQNGVTNSPLGQGYTDSNGNFVINIDNPGANGVKVVLFAYKKWTIGEVARTQTADRELRVISQGTTLSDLDFIYSWQIKNAVQFSDGDHSFGQLSVPKGDRDEKACWILEDLNKAFLYTPGDPRGCTVKWAWDSTDGTYFSPGDKQVHLKAADPINTDNAVHHEYGHNIMYNAWYLPTDCPDSHYIHKESGPICGWKEGWAEFFDLAVDNDPIYHLEKVGSTEMNHDVEKGEALWAQIPWDTGDRCEGRVAGALWDLLDNTPNEGSDWYSFGVNPIWNAMVNNGAVVNDFRKFWSIWLGQANSRYAANCLLQNTIDYWPSRSIALRASNGKYVCADGGGGHRLIADRDWIGAWETFKLIDLGDGNVALQANNGQYVCAEGGGGSSVVADRSHFDAWETFKLIDLGNGDVALQTNNNKYVCAEVGSSKQVVANRDTRGAWETFKLIDLTPQPVALRASNGQYVVAEFGGGDGVFANRPVPSIWETFGLINLGSNNVALRANNGQYFVAEFGGGDGVFANRDWIGAWETFELKDQGSGNVALRANNGQYVCAENGGGYGVVANRNAIGAWETFARVNTPRINTDPIEIWPGENNTVKDEGASTRNNNGSGCASC